MNVIAFILAVMLAVQAAPESPCRVNDNACKAPDFERRADQTTDPVVRAWRLHAAHRSYIFLFDETGNLAHLCEARRAYERSLAVKDLPARERAGLTARLADLETRERQYKPRCSKNASRPRRDPPLISKASPNRATDTTPPAPDMAPVASSAEAPPAGLVVVADKPHADHRPVSPLLEDPPARPEIETDPLLPIRRPSPPPRRAGRPLVMVGSVTMLGGLALAGGAGFVGARLVDIRHQGETLAGAVDGYGTAEEVAQDAALRGAYRRTSAQTVALAVSGGAVLIIGGVLTGIGARRMARAVSRAALLPAPGGLALRVRF